jgi:competence protein ComEA
VGYDRRAVRPVFGLTVPVAMACAISIEEQAMTTRYLKKCGSFSGLLLLATLVACTQRQSPQELREKTAQATAEAASDAKAVAEGIRDGLNHDRPLDLNSATKEQLTSLPGVTADEADRILSGRPYSDPHELVTRRILPKPEYDRISDRITAGR